MKIKLTILSFMVVLAIVLMYSNSQARSRATVKQQTIRSENPKMGEEWLVLPYAFATDDLGTVLTIDR